MIYDNAVLCGITEPPADKTLTRRGRVPEVPIALLDVTSQEAG